MKHFRLGYFIEFDAEGVDVTDAHHRVEMAFLERLADGTREVEAPRNVRTRARLHKTPLWIVGYKLDPEDGFVGYLNTEEGRKRFPEGTRFPKTTASPEERPSVASPEGKASLEGYAAGYAAGMDEVIRVPEAYGLIKPTIQHHDDIDT